MMKKTQQDSAATSKTSKQKSNTIRRRQTQRTKKQIGIALLKRRNGTHLTEMQKSMGWQSHSVRSFLATTAKTVPDFTLISEKPNGKRRRYRLKPAKEA